MTKILYVKENKNLKNFELQLNISANLTREDRAYLEKIDAQLLGLLAGKHVREVDDPKKLEKIWDLVKARGAYLRATADERNELRESVIEKTFGSQYEKQIGYLKDAGFVDKNGNIIDALDGKEYPLPTKEQVMTYLEGKKELLEVKMKQGFTRLLLVPIGMKLNTMVELTGEVMKAKQVKKLLKYPGGVVISDEEFNLHELLYFAPEWDSSDENGNCKYYAERFEINNHGGKTKREVLEAQSQELKGWEILVVEHNQVLPKKNVIEEIGGRHRITANNNADEYRALLRDNDFYLGEKGMTNEAWLTQLLMSVSETGEVLDDWDGDGCANISLSSYLPDDTLDDHGAVAWSNWSRNDQRREGLSWNGPGARSPEVGFRSAV